MKKKNLFSLLIISSTFALAGGVLSSNLGFNSPKTVMAEGEDETQETETATLVINQELLNWDTSKFTSYTKVKVGGTDLTYSTTSTVKGDKGCLVWNYYSKTGKYGGIYNTVALPGPITSISYEMDSYVANAVYVGTASNPSTNESAFESGEETGSFTYDKSSNYTYFKVVQTASSGTSYFKSITIKYETPKADSITDFSIDKSTLELNALETYQLKATILPTTADQKVIYKSSDPFVASVGANGVITGLKSGTAKITATTVGKDADGNQKTASCDVSVMSSVSIGDLRDEKGELKTTYKGKTLSLSGVITSIDTAQNQMTIEDNGKAILLYKMNDVAGYKVGDKVNALGSASSYNGLLELSGVTKDTVVVVGTGDVPSPTVLEKTDLTSLRGMDSLIFKATGKLDKALTSLSSDTTIGFTLTNGQKINIFSKAAVGSKIGAKLIAYLNKVGTKGTVTFTLPLGWYKNPQLSMLPDMSVVSSTDVDAVDKFVTDFMHPEVNTTDAGTGKCVSENWYSLAKEAYDALTTDQKAMFDTCTGYKDMKARFDAWAKANPSQTGLNNVFYNDNNNNLAIYIGTGLALTSVAAMALLIINKKKKHSK